jgi:hypothetical protein
MIIKKYGTIQDFIKIKEQCIFCFQPLSPILTNLFGHRAPSIPEIVSHLYNNQFQFRLKYDGDFSDFDVSATINIEDNRFSYYHGGYSNIRDGAVGDVFTSMKPYVELVCENKECKMGYYLQSEFLWVERDNSIRSVGILSEAFVLDQWWISNNYNNLTPYTCTSIFSRTHKIVGQANPPVICPRIDFEAISKEKLINKIRTIVTFS